MTSNPTRTYALGQAFKFPGKGYRFQNFKVGGKVSVEGTDKRFEFLPSGYFAARTGPHASFPGQDD